MATIQNLANEMAIVKENIDKWLLNRQQLIDEALKYYGITDESILLNTRGTFGKEKGKVKDSLFARYLKETGKADPSESFPKTSVNVGNTELAFDIEAGKWELNVDELNIMQKNTDAQKWYQRIKNKDGILGKQYKGKPFASLNSGNKMNVAKAYIEQRVLPNLPLDTPVVIKGGSISSQALGTGLKEKASGDKKTKRYIDWWINKPTEGFAQVDDQIIFTNTGKPINPKPWVKGAVPDDVVRKRFAEYIESRDIRDATGAKRAKGQFFHKGMGYTFSSQGQGRPSSLVAPDGTPFKVVASKDLSLKEANRRATKLGATPKLDPWEWRAMEELYDFAGKHGYHVDHKIPLDAGVEAGGIHHWSNLQVLDANDNLVKGAKEGVEELLGIKPKMVGQLSIGPFTYDDWQKAQGKIETIEAQKVQSKLMRAVGRGQEIDTGVHNLYIDQPGDLMDEALKKQQLLLDTRNPDGTLRWPDLKAGSEASGGLKNALRKAGTVLPFIGAGLDAWDVQQRWEEVMNNPNEGFTDWLDKAQLGIASATLGTSFWAEPANFALGVTNLGIDAARTVFEEDKRKNFLKNMRAIGRGTTYAAQQLL